MDKEKAYFFPRLLAYLIDIFIVTLIATLISMPFTNENLEKLTNDLNNLSEKYMSQEITAKEFVNQYVDLDYDINYNSVPSTIISVVCFICYFVIFQFYNKGQTIGKKLMKIKIVSNNGEELTINNYLYRSFLLNAVAVNIILIFLVLFMNKNYCFYLSIPLQFIQEVLLLVTVFMVLFKKDGRGLHDKLGNTKVIMND